MQCAIAKYIQRIDAAEYRNLIANSFRPRIVGTRFHTVSPPGAVRQREVADRFIVKGERTWVASPLADATVLKSGRIALRGLWATQKPQDYCLTSIYTTKPSAVPAAQQNGWSREQAQ